MVQIQIEIIIIHDGNLMMRNKRSNDFFCYRSNDDGSEENDDHNEHDDDDNDDDDDDDEDDDETDESIARRLGFVPLNPTTINLISRLRNLTTKKSFGQRDFEIFQSLIDELIHLQHLENASKYELKDIIHHLKLHRPLRSKSRALIFLQERIPRRAVKYNVVSANNSNVFNIWRERERRARIDSKDSLEDDGQHLGGQQLRDVVEINHPTPPIILSVTNYNNSNSNGITKVKQMAKDIDTRSVSSRSEINFRTGDRFSDHTYIPRSASPTYPGLVSVAVYDVKTTNHGGALNESLNNKRVINTTSSISPTVSEPSHVRKMIDRLESSSTSSSDVKKTAIKKSLHDDHSDGSTSITSSPPVKRVARRDQNEKSFLNGNGSLHSHQNGSANDVVLRKNTSSEIKVEVNRDDIRNTGRRTASGTTVSIRFEKEEVDRYIPVDFFLDGRICHYSSSWN
jgi:hypothetical protein